VAFTPFPTFTTVSGEDLYEVPPTVQSVATTKLTLSSFMSYWSSKAITYL
jgi:hypothetical protein